MDDEIIKEKKTEAGDTAPVNLGENSVLRDMLADVPTPHPAAGKLKALGAGGDHEAANSDRLAAAVEVPVIEKDPKAYAYVQDHKGRAFDPEIHWVDENGDPILNTNGQIKMLPKGETNPVKVAFNNLIGFFDKDHPKEEERSPEQRTAQAVVQSVESERMQAAEIVVDLYGGAGYVLRGAPFRKNWEKQRRQKLVDAVVRYQRLKNMVIPIKAEWILYHAFGSDLLTVEGEAMFERKGGILGFIGRKGWNFRAEQLIKHVVESDNEGEQDNKNNRNNAEKGEKGEK